MPEEDQECLATQLNVKLVQQPSKYLDLQFKLGGKKVIEYLMDIVKGKLQGWKAKLLSQEGRTTLISFVLQSLPLYTFSYL